MINDLVRISNRYGGDSNFVLAGGGNTSAKDKHGLYVKASGVPMRGITEKGFVKLSLQQVLRVFDLPCPQDAKEREAAVLQNLLSAREPGEEHKRPSVETLLHALLPGRFVVHTHPALLNGLTCSRQGERMAKLLFGGHALWIPYTDPGYTLARVVKARLDALSARKRPLPNALILQNHGLIVSGDSPAAIEKTTRRILEPLRLRLRRLPDLVPSAAADHRAGLLAPVVRMVYKGDGPSAICAFACNGEILKRTASRAAFRPVSAPLTPDHIVYCQAYPLFVRERRTVEQQSREIASAMKGYNAKFGVGPKIVAVERLGVFACGASQAQAETALSLFQDTLSIAAYAESFGGVSPMSAKQADFICRWEAETYRKTVSFAGNPKRLAEKIAVVTGGAQGFGKGISEALLLEGAHVVVADLNIALAQATAEELGRTHGAGKAVAHPVDVTSEDSVKALLNWTALRFGGVDILVSNAGILKAGSLTGQRFQDFELVTRVNYNGFYLCAKHAADIMMAQHAYAPKYFMDIIQINSKSGLSGSKNNFAYAGSKFGGIGLAQSFALELVDYNIKVNAICPGNFFDGPLWSDPKNGLFVQYLQTRKVPGAKTIEDVRRFYESKVPMKRGCTVEDVAKALIYLIEQKYETGQALPVTGGQCMLK